MKSPYGILGGDDCFYIPSYQRNFGWGKEQISRFFEDLMHGVNSLEDAGTEYTETFLGTVICFIDKPQFESVSPYIPNDHPGSIQVVVDGQQRLTISLMMAMLFHDYLRKNKINQGGPGKENQLALLQGHVMKRLKKMLFIEPAPEGDMGYYPRMIRGPKDQWSRWAGENASRYVSPVSKLISEYLTFIGNEDKTSNKVQRFIPEGKKNSSSEDKDFYNVFAESERLIKNITSNEIKEGGPYDRLPNIEKIFNPERGRLISALFSMTGGNFFKEAQENLKQLQAVSEESGTKQDKKAFDQAQKELQKEFSVARCLLVAAYFMNRMKLVLMQTTSQEYAFRIFDSLNTTGDPLTAYETFRPEVISRFNSTETYQVSKEHRYIQEIDSYLNSKEVAEQSKKTSEYITAFALAETGDRESKNLTDQRHYLLSKYRKHCLIGQEINREKSEQFMLNMLYVSRVNEYFVAKKQEKASITYKFIEFIIAPKDNEGKHQDLTNQHKCLAREAMFCLDFLAEAKHSIVIPVISRFYDKAITSKRIVDHANLCKAIRTVAAFFAIWRISRNDTDSIDNHHREIMKGSKRGKTEASSADDIRTLTNAGYRRQGEISPDLDHLQDTLKTLLGDSEKTSRPISSDKEWIELAKKIPIYKKSKPVAKFVLILSMYISGLRSENTQATSTRGQLIFDRLWNHDAHESIEHIRPQKEAEEKGLNTEQRELLQSVGNLTLLPSDINSFLGAADWNQKRAIYFALSYYLSSAFTKSKDELWVVLKDIDISTEQEGFEEMVTKVKEVIDKFPDRYLPEMESISQIPDFNFTEIEKRSEDVLESVWPILSDWLGR